MRSGPSSIDAPLKSGWIDRVAVEIAVRHSPIDLREREARTAAFFTTAYAVIISRGICVTPRAELLFHAAYGPPPPQRQIDESASDCPPLHAIYPIKIRRWIDRHGGLSRRGIFLRGRALSAMYRARRADQVAKRAVAIPARFPEQSAAQKAEAHRLCPKHRQRERSVGWGPTTPAPAEVGELSARNRSKKQVGVQNRINGGESVSQSPLKNNAFLLSRGQNLPI